MKAIRNRILTLAAVGLLGIGLSASASQAQALYKGSFTLPQEVRWQNATMPAGEYTFRVDSLTRNEPVIVTGPAGTVFQMPLVTSEIKYGDRSFLKLERRGGELYVGEMDLAQVGINISYDVPKATATDKLIANANTDTDQVLVAMTK